MKKTKGKKETKNADEVIPKSMHKNMCEKKKKTKKKATRQISQG
ncbi:MAG: hypothetical protein Devi2KO_40470 [Devosia indica]